MWDQILREVEQIQRKWHKRGNTVWYRGQTCSKWSLKPSLQRFVEETILKSGKPATDTDDKNLFFSFYKSFYHRFRARAWQLLDSGQRSPWGTIFTMQHFGLPTPLLDWTESFACALYFANFKRKPDEDAAIFLINPEGLNEQSIQRNGLVSLDQELRPLDTPYHPQIVASDQVLPTIAVAPFLSNSRMGAQRAAFTLSGASFTPLEEEADDHVHKIVLPAETYQDSQRFLDLVGIGHFGYFPDIEGLVKDMLLDHEKLLEYGRRLMTEK